MPELRARPKRRIRSRARGMRADGPWLGLMALALAGGCARASVPFVSSQRADLVGVRGTLGEARCKVVPRAEGAVLRRADVEREGCATRRYSGDLSVHAVDSQGVASPTLLRVPVEDGGFTLTFAQLAEALGEASDDRALGSLTFVLGQGGWAGTISIPIAERRAVHARAITLGRGSPGLFASVPGVASSGDAWALATEARLARQERDYLDVGRGRLAPARFLRRHPWSPYRESVVGMLERVSRAP